MEKQEVTCNESENQEKKRVKFTIHRKAGEGNWNKDESGELRETTGMDIERRKFLTVGFQQCQM